MELLPQWYASKHTNSLKTAKLELASFFRDVGPYDYRYYDWRYWAKELQHSSSFDDMVVQLRHTPHLYPPMKLFINDLYVKGVPLIIISSTTHDFISCELDNNASYFSHIFSSLDDFKIPGKPQTLYSQICDKLQVNPADILHIGDSQEMDIINASKAGLDTYFVERSVDQSEHVSRIKQRYCL
jgi:HAD superfamily hydrolase (TIGR01549 family)